MKDETDCPSYPLIWQWHLTYPAKRDQQYQGRHEPVNNEYNKYNVYNDHKMCNANNEYNKYNLLGLSLVFESHVLENIVD